MKKINFKKLDWDELALEIILMNKFFEESKYEMSKKDQKAWIANIDLYEKEKQKRIEQECHLIRVQFGLPHPLRRLELS